MAKEQSGFALIELFTSEGCSSCPAADEALEDIQKKYSDKNVLVLGYHVDYWDNLGWKDIFSNPLFTQRQEYYSNIFRLNSIYTPQAVVNGKNEFVGSNKTKLVSSINEQLNEQPTASINLKAALDNSGKIDVSYSSQSPNSKNEQLVLLLVQKMATNKIRRGENEGRTLHHINIVRELYELSIPVKEEKKTFTLPTELKKEDVFVTAFIQNTKTGKITGLQSSEVN